MEVTPSFGVPARRIVALHSQHDQSVLPEHLRNHMAWPERTSQEQTMTDAAEVLLQKIRSLPPQRLAEVADFVDFLQAREDRERTKKVDELFGMMDQLATIEPPLTPEEIQAEIDAARAERHANRR
jgi:hypothetical protein